MMILSNNNELALSKQFCSVFDGCSYVDCLAIVYQPFLCKTWRVRDFTLIGVVEAGYNFAIIAFSSQFLSLN